MDISAALGSDLAILLFSAAGLFATAVAIVHDTKTQAADLAKGTVEIRIR
jgi:hypothetical protein